MTSQGSASGRFTRAIGQRNLFAAEVALKEMGSPGYVMEQMGHTDAKLALEVYNKVLNRTRSTGARMDALVRDAVMAEVGTNGTSPTEPVAVEENRNPLSPAGL